MGKQVERRLAWALVTHPARGKQIPRRSESVCTPANAPAPTQGNIMPISEQFLTAFERPRCSRCQARMMLERVSPGPIGFERRLFECPKCDHVETSLIALDPFNPMRPVGPPASSGR